MREVVSASTTTGVIDATLYGASADSKFVFCTEVRSTPVVDLIEINTFPYSGVSLTPVLVS